MAQLVAEVKHFFHQGLQGGQGAEFTTRLQQYCQSDAFFTACAHLFVAERDPGNVGIRIGAGVQLKNNMANPLCVKNPEVQRLTMLALQDELPPIRRTAGSIITRGVALNVWPLATIVQTLAGAVRTPGVPAAYREGCLQTLHYLVEDHVDTMEAQGLPGVQLVGAIAALFAPLVVDTSPSVRLAALDSTKILLERANDVPDGPVMTALTQQNIAPLLLPGLGQLLMSAGQDPSLSTALQCVYLLFPFHQHISPMFDGIVDFVVSKHADRSQEVRMQVAEFWRAVLTIPEFAERSKRVMGPVLEFLLNGMIYSDMELSMLQGGENDWNQADKPEDVRPRSYRAKTQLKSDEENAGDESDEVEEHSVRRSCAATLDATAYHHGDSILNSVLGCVDQRMKPERSWQEQESAVLALGAISNGCIDGVQPYLPQIIPQLLLWGGDDRVHYLVRSICLWALGCYAEWIFEHPDSVAKGLPVSFVRLLVTRMQSPSKRLQEAATAALAQVAGLSAASPVLVAEATTILTAIGACFRAYQLKNRYLLFESLAALVRPVSTALSDETNLNLLMGPLVEMWSQTPDNSPLLFPYFSCMSFVCSAVGDSIRSIASDLFSRALRLCELYVKGRAQSASANAPMPDDSEEFVSVSTELLSGLAEALGAGMEPLMQSVGPDGINRMYALIQLVVTDVSPEIRVHGFGLVGELAKGMPSFVQRQLEPILGLLFPPFENLQCPRVTAQAAWALSWIAASQVEAPGNQCLTERHIDAFVGRIAAMVTQPDDADTRYACENLCICLGVLVSVDPSCPQRHAQVFVALAAPWCRYVRNVQQNALKTTAIQAMLPVLALCAQGLAPHLSFVVDLCNSLSQSRSCGIDARDVTGFLNAVKQALGAAAWQSGMQRCHPDVVGKLYRTFGVR